MNDNELVKALRWMSKVRICETKMVNCHECEFHGFCTDPDSDESIANQIVFHEQAATRIEQLSRDNNTLRNELCLKCGLYKTEHEGSCDGCRWGKRDV